MLSSQYFDDHAARRDVLDVSVRCGNYGSDCQWTGKFRELNVRDYVHVCVLMD